MSAPTVGPTMTTPLSTEATRKLRILCLHGYLQNAEIFRSRIGSMRKALKSRAEFLFIDAPYMSNPIDAVSQQEEAVREIDGSATEGRSWWQWKDIEPATRPSRAAQYSGWEESQRVIEQGIKDNWPVDGLLGFSQGATAIALYLASDANGSESYSPNFAILIGGFMPRDANYADKIRNAAPLGVPSLFVTGQQDALVPRERSAELWNCFSDSVISDSGIRVIYEHPGAHMVPTCSGDWKKTVATFLDHRRK